MRYYTPEEIAAIEAATPPGLPKVWVHFLWRTGLRANEALHVMHRDIYYNTQPPVVVVNQAKGGRVRAVPLHKDLISMLQAVPVTSDRLFPWSYQTGLRIVQKAIREAGVTGWSLFIQERAPGPHSLRHSAARYWMAEGVPLPRISQWLGHKNSVVTQEIYQPLAPDDSGDMDKVR